MSTPESYASIDDFRGCGLPAAALAFTDLNVVQGQLCRASRIADTFLRDRYKLPLHAPIDPALTLWVCWIAAYMLLSSRGFNPNQSGIDTVVRMNYQDAIDALKRVANGQQQLCVCQTAPGATEPIVGSNPTRGFGGLTGGQDVPIIGPNTWGT